MIWPWARHAAAEVSRREREASAAEQNRQAGRRLAETRKLAAESRIAEDAKRRELDKNSWTELFAQAMERRRA